MVQPERRIRVHALDDALVSESAYLLAGDHALGDGMAGDEDTVE
jgi:hypothetical protein